MTIWCLITLVQQPHLTSVIIQPKFELIEGEQIHIINSLRSFTFETKEILSKWRNAANILDKQEEKSDILRSEGPYYHFLHGNKYHLFHDLVLIFMISHKIKILKRRSIFHHFKRRHHSLNFIRKRALNLYHNQDNLIRNFYCRPLLGDLDLYVQIVPII